jgi:lysophospholipase L1-like esterase
MSRLLRQSLKLLIGFVLAIAVGELILSRSSLIDSPPGQYRRSETRAFEHSPDFRGKDRHGNPIIINSHGFRGGERALAKPSGVFRILVLGDSVAFGQGVAAEATFSDQLERLLNEASSDLEVEVLNSGVRGYNTYQELLLLKEVGFKFDPDLVLVSYVSNDAEPFSNQAGLIDKKHKWLVSLKDLVKRHSYLYAFFRKQIAVMQNRMTPAEFVDAGLDHFNPDDPGWKASYDSLKQMKQLTDQHHAILSLAVLPQLKGLGPGEVHPDKSRGMHERVLKAGAELGIDTIDLLPSLKGNETGSLRLVDDDPMHPNARGHLLIAEALSEHIRERYLEDSGEGG